MTRACRGRALGRGTIRSKMVQRPVEGITGPRNRVHAKKPEQSIFFPERMFCLVGRRAPTDCMRTFARQYSHKACRRPVQELVTREVYPVASSPAEVVRQNRLATTLCDVWPVVPYTKMTRATSTKEVADVFRTEVCAVSTGTPLGFTLWSYPYKMYDCIQCTRFRMWAKKKNGN